MESRHFLCAVGAGVLLATGVALADPAATDEAAPPAMPKQVGVIDDTGGMPQVKQQNGISYISGGAGSDEADVLNRMADQFNLKLTMSVPSGQFTSPTSLIIEDASGKTVLDIKPNGPILLAKMPSGEYVINVTAEGEKRTKKVQVPTSGLESVALTWPPAGEPSRAGDAPIPAERPIDMPRTIP